MYQANRTSKGSIIMAKSTVTFIRPGFRISGGVEDPHTLHLVTEVEYIKSFRAGFGPVITLCEQLFRPSFFSKTGWPDDVFCEGCAAVYKRGDNVRK